MHLFIQLYIYLYNYTTIQLTTNYLQLTIQQFRNNCTMGIHESTQQILQIPSNCKIYSILPIASSTEEVNMEIILTRRYECFKDCIYIYSDTFTIPCRYDRKLAVFYDQYDYKLADIPLQCYPNKFVESEIAYLVLCLARGLYCMKMHGLHHGDIHPDNIVYSKRRQIGPQSGYWRLLDKMFINNGISAYQKQLEGQQGFVSPKQMEMIRHGFTKQSPSITEADDIFALGLIVLQLASRVPSRLCYKDSYIRINQQVLDSNFEQTKKVISFEFRNVLSRMLNFQQCQRITIEELLSHPLIQGSVNRTAKKSQQLRNPTLMPHGNNTPTKPNTPILGSVSPRLYVPSNGPSNGPSNSPYPNAPSNSPYYSNGNYNNPYYNTNNKYRQYIPVVQNSGQQYYHRNHLGRLSNGK